jgi:inner membrane protein
MDPVSHALLGAAMAQSTARDRDARIAAAIGGIAGLAADLDALIDSAEDALLNLEFHRHFSHALLFAPVGALLVAAVLWLLLRNRIALGPLRLYGYALAGYGLAGLLDACTSYGTHLWWPFTESRVAWSIVPIVDPVFTMLLAIPLGIGIARRRPVAARIALSLGAAYLAIGFLQHQRADAMARELAAQRGHRPERLIVKPTIGNLVLWRSVYVAGDRIHVDAVRPGIGRGIRTYPGEGRRRLDPARDLDWAPPGSRAHADTARFAVFSDGFLVAHPTRAGFIGDARYALLPTRIEPLWGIALDPASPQRPARFVTDRKLTPAVRQQFIDMVLGRD